MRGLDQQVIGAICRHNLVVNRAEGVLAEGSMCLCIGERLWPLFQDPAHPLRSLGRLRECRGFCGCRVILGGRWEVLESGSRGRVGTSAEGVAFMCVTSGRGEPG